MQSYKLYLQWRKPFGLFLVVLVAVAGLPLSFGRSLPVEPGPSPLDPTHPATFPPRQARFPAR